MSTTKKKSGKGDPCWDGYEQVGMKTKNGKSVPDCVPVKKKTAAKKSAPKKVAAKKAASKSPAKKAAARKSGPKKKASKKA